jgi:hypothetical protein
MRTREDLVASWVFPLRPDGCTPPAVADGLHLQHSSAQWYAARWFASAAPSPVVLTRVGRGEWLAPIGPSGGEVMTCAISCTAFSAKVLLRFDIRGECIQQWLTFSSVVRVPR